MKILVTGGAGFIGEHIVQRCLDDGHEVIVIDNLSAEFTNEVPPEATFYRTNILNGDQLTEIIGDEKPDVVNHQAAQTGVRTSTGRRLYDAMTNIIGSINVIDACINGGVKKMIYAGSGGTVYGNRPVQPLDEETPKHPISNYGVSKYAAELYLNQSRITEGFNATTLRYANVYGASRKRCGVINVIIDCLLAGESPVLFGDGQSTRDYLYVTDIVEANMLALKPETDFDTFNVGTCRPVSLSYLFNLCKIITECDESIKPLWRPANPEEVDHVQLNSAKFIEATGWEVQVPLAVGIRKVIKAARSE